MTGTFEPWVLRDYAVTALLADKQAFPAKQHRSEVIPQNAIRAANDLLNHFEPSALSLSGYAHPPQPLRPWWRLLSAPSQ